MSTYIPLIPLIASLVMLLTDRNGSRLKLFLYSFLLSFIVVCIIHSGDSDVEVPYDMAVSGYRHGISDAPIYSQTGFIYYSTQTLIYTAIWFGLLALFIRKRAKAIGDYSNRKEGNSESIGTEEFLDKTIDEMIEIIGGMSDSEYKRFLAKMDKGEFKKFMDKQNEMNDEQVSRYLSKRGYMNEEEFKKVIAEMINKRQGAG